MGMPGSFDQTNFAFYAEGTESGAVIVGTAGAQQSLDVDTTYQCRVLMDEIGGSDADDFETPTFEYEVAQSGTWVSITTSSSVIQTVNSGSLTDGGDTTDRLSSAVITPNAWVTEDGTLPTLSYLAGESCQALLSFQIVGADVSNGQEIRIRLTASPVPAWTAEADIDVVKVSGARRRSNVT